MKEKDLEVIFDAVLFLSLKYIFTLNYDIHWQTRQEINKENNQIEDNLDVLYIKFSEVKKKTHGNEKRKFTCRTS